MKPALALTGVGFATILFGLVAYTQIGSLPDTIDTSVDSFGVMPGMSPVQVLSPKHHRGSTVEVISWSPRILVVDDLLTYEECDEMMRMAHPNLEKSTVVNVANGKSIPSSVRTSDGAFLGGSLKNSPVVKRVEKRLAYLTMLPEENGESIQVLRYEVGQYYRPHHDFFADEFNKRRGGQRVATVLIYLSTPEQGGETIFPQAGQPSDQAECGGKMVKGMSVKAEKGRAVVFWSQTPAGAEDPRSLHGSCDVIKGVKW
eukprot:CAMPEP_0196570654 /NCGR_PEP_ID=MMETSP1081-20130531/795_1 /TAXON_ID=36882 /ORGANISM="Pyramimonas amylifera, Strain CCMP720" /LENGTH=257 /DNA_ID=CAMNT_0041887207 /DNA_START=121 /DNA_END=891 /DNA_ORIENTATION=-